MDEEPDIFELQSERVQISGDRYLIFYRFAVRREQTRSRSVKDKVQPAEDDQVSRNV